MKKLLICIACVSTTFIATPARGQFDALSKLADNFSDLAIQWGAFHPRLKELHPEDEPKSRWLGSFGAEFIFDITKVNTHEKESPNKRKCNIVKRGDPKERHITLAHGERDTVNVVDIYALDSACKESEPNLELELGVGFFQTSRFRIGDPIGAYTGYFRETPAITIYATWLRVPKLRRFKLKPYGGLRAGVTELVSPSLEDPQARRFAGSAAKSVEIGGVVGLYREFPWNLPGSVFVEASHMYRPLKGISWAANTDIKDTSVPAPAEARKRIDFTGKSLMVGLQITVKKPDADKK